MVKAVNKYMAENTGELYDTPADAIEAERKSKDMTTTETEMQIQIGSLLWVYGADVCEDVANEHVGLLVKSKDGSEFRVVITKNEADRDG